MSGGGAGVASAHLPVLYAEVMDGLAVKQGGTYLDGTKAAVRAFQKDNKLSVNGTADKKTQEALYALVALTTTPAPTPMPTDPPELVVDVTPEVEDAYQVEESNPA